MADKSHETHENSKNKYNFAIQRIYTKDISLEMPQAPAIFASEWNPEVELNIKVDHHEISDLLQDGHEVSLEVTLNAKLPNKRTAILIELTQAGIFKITGWEGEELKRMLGAFCPGIIFPYAREQIADLMTRANLPPFHLAPINFDAFYEQRKAQKAAENKTK